MGVTPHGLELNSRSNGGKTKAVNSIVSDYKVIKPNIILLITS